MGSHPYSQFPNSPFASFSLLLSEAIEPHDLAAARRFIGLLALGRRRRLGIGGRRDRDGRGGALVLGRRACLAGSLAGRRALLAVLPVGFALPGRRDLLELQAELHRRIEEAFDRGEGDRQSLRDAAKRQAD